MSSPTRIDNSLVAQFMVIINMCNYGITGSKLKKKILNKSEKRYTPTIFNYADKIHAKRLRGDKCEKLFSVLDLLFLLIIQQEKPMEASESYENQNSSYRGNFQ